MPRPLPLFLSFACLALTALVGSAADITGSGKRFFACDYKQKVMAIIAADGTVEWKREMRGSCHDAWVMPDGRILWTPSNGKIFVTDTTTSSDTLLYDSATQGGITGRVEIHGFQPLADGTIMVFESGPKRAVHIDQQGTVLKTVALPIEKGDPHHQTRNARVLANGHLLMALSHDSRIVECDSDGKVVWQLPTPKECYSAIRLPDGNTLIGGGHNHRVFEVDAAGVEVWSIGEDELPGIRLAYVAQVQRLANGNTVFVNCHAGPDHPQIIEVTRDKRVIWSYRDFELFGNAVPVGFVIAEDAIR